MTSVSTSIDLKAMEMWTQGTNERLDHGRSHLCGSSSTNADFTKKGNLVSFLEFQVQKRQKVETKSCHWLVLPASACWRCCVRLEETVSLPSAWVWHALCTEETASYQLDISWRVPVNCIICLQLYHHASKQPLEKCTTLRSCQRPCTRTKPLKTWPQNGRSRAERCLHAETEWLTVSPVFKRWVGNLPIEQQFAVCSDCCTRWSRMTESLGESTMHLFVNTKHIALKCWCKIDDTKFG